MYGWVRRLQILLLLFFFNSQQYRAKTTITTRWRRLRYQQRWSWSSRRRVNPLLFVSFLCLILSFVSILCYFAFSFGFSSFFVWLQFFVFFFRSYYLTCQVFSSQECQELAKSEKLWWTRSSAKNVKVMHLVNRDDSRGSFLAGRKSDGGYQNYIDKYWQEKKTGHWMPCFNQWWRHFFVWKASTSRLGESSQTVRV